MPEPPRLDRSDLLGLLVLGGLWGSAFIAIRAGILAGASPFLFADLRFVLAAVAATLLALVTRTVFPARALFVRALILGGLSLIGGYSVLVYWGEASTPGGLSAVLIATVPLWSGLLGHPVLPGERFGARGWVGIVTGFAGVVLLLSPSLGADAVVGILGPLAIVGAALVFSVGSVILRKLGGGPEGYWSLSAQFSAAAIVLVPFVLLAGPESFPVTTLTVGTLVFLALGSSVLGFIVYFRLHHRVGPARASFVTYVSPVIGLALGAAFLGESVSLVEVAGFALIVLGVLLVRGDQRKPTGPGGGAP